MGQGGITILVGTTKGAFLISGGSDGRGPFSNVTLDANGNLYGTTWEGGDVSGNCESLFLGCGVVWEITP